MCRNKNEGRGLAALGLAALCLAALGRQCRPDQRPTAIAMARFVRDEDGDEADAEAVAAAADEATDAAADDDDAAITRRQRASLHSPVHQSERTKRRL